MTAVSVLGDARAIAAALGGRVSGRDTVLCRDRDTARVTAPSGAA
jgi:hypothetical protein